MNGPQLVAEYNRCAAILNLPTVKRFPDLASGQKRVAAIQAKLPKEKTPWMKDPANKEKMRENAKRMWADPEFRARMAERTKAQWSDPEMRARMVEGIRNPKIVMSPEQKRERQIAALKAKLAKLEGSL